MTKAQRALFEFGKMSAAKLDWTGIMVTFDPNPTSACLKPCDPLNLAVLETDLRV